jgi:hypothetical protein
MNNMKRKEFLKMGGLTLLAPLGNSLLMRAAANTGKNNWDNDDIMQRLLAANDKQVDQLLETVRPGNLSFSRKIGYDIATFSSSYCYVKSKYYHSAVIIPKIELLVDFLASSQATDGTVNVGNLESPPDTAFLMEILCTAAAILIKDGSKELSAINTGLKKIITKAGDALSKGGVHTPNHRWVISAALSQINALYPDKKYTDRINDWLGEGVYIDKDGHFPERSGTYSAVETTAFISIARALNKPALLEPVRKNLDMYFYYIEQNGELVSNDSRRQDQYAPRSAALFYMQFRYMAIRDNNSHFAAIAKMLESAILFDFEVLNRSLFYFLENETMQKTLPVPEQLPESYEKLFTTSHLLRIKRKNITTTLFGGVDWPLTIASGRSCSPNFFSYRKGKAILKYMRLSSDFFSMGYFYSEGIKKEGNKYILHKKLVVPYYQPLPKDKRNSSGDYKLTPSIDDRFWNKMDFKNRPLSNIKTLDTTITFTENNGVVDLDIEVKGLQGLPVTVELCFTEGGKLSGVSAPENENYFLENGNGKYEFEGDAINFGPGAAAVKKIDNLEGERYSTHFGSLRTKGMHVYLAGITPFTHKLFFS